MRLLYLYPEEWNGRRAREVHTLSTCVALTESGIEVTLITAGGARELQAHLEDVAGKSNVPGLHLVTLTRKWGPVRSAVIFKHHFHKWRRTQPRFDWAFIIHLKAATMLVHEHVMPYAYEAHEIFAQTPQKSEARQIKLHELERHVLAGATLRVATSASLAAALSTWYALPNDFEIVPNAGLPPLAGVLSRENGPFVYCGSIADWKGLDLLIHASRDAGVPLKIVGGTDEEWRRLGQQLDTTRIEWQPRVSLTDLPKVLTGARAGLIATQPEAPSGRYSCPMKLFDYARCGLPVISTALPSLQSLDAGSWCVEVPEPTRAAWSKALKSFRYETHQAEAAQTWAAEHTWKQRGEKLARALSNRNVAR